MASPGGQFVSHGCARDYIRLTCPDLLSWHQQPYFSFPWPLYHKQKCQEGLLQTPRRNESSLAPPLVHPLTLVSMEARAKADCAIQRSITDEVGFSVNQLTMIGFKRLYGHNEKENTEQKLIWLQDGTS